MTKHMIPKIGDFVKVWLPGESPWAECVAVDGDTWHGRIDNLLFAQDAELRKKFTQEHFGRGDPLPSLHDYKQDQIIRFGLKEGVWQPVEMAGGRA